jgi:hypothetical protein
MALFAGAARQVPPRFLAPEANLQHSASGQAIERQARADEGHRANFR